MTRVYILAFVMSNYFMFAVNAVQVAQLQPKEKDAYSNDINKCFFNTWNSYTKGVGVTNNVMNCELEPNRVGLCYGLLSSGKWIPSFAVCYDKTTLIPVFTGHIVSPHGAVNNENREFRNEAGDYAPIQGEQSDQKVDYSSGMFDRGHLTPRSAFGTTKGQDLTMINTNIAPQFPPFNSGNWAKLEQAVLAYSNDKKWDIYVVTGTGGQNLNSLGQPTFQNDRVVVPKYFWKAVCDPNLKSSVVFVGANPTGIEGKDGPPKQAGCMLNNIPPAPEMTTRLGIIQCYSLKELKRQPESKFFSLPPFGEKCDPSQRGTFLDTYLQSLN